MSSSSETTLEAIFKEAAASDGTVSIDEFKSLSHLLSLPLPSSSVHDAFAIVDTSKRGRFTFQEFLGRLEPFLMFIQSKAPAGSPSPVKVMSRIGSAQRRGSVSSRSSSPGHRRESIIESSQDARPKSWCLTSASPILLKTPTSVSPKNFRGLSNRRRSSASSLNISMEDLRRELDRSTFKSSRSTSRIGSSNENSPPLYRRATVGTKLTEIDTQSITAKSENEPRLSSDMCDNSSYSSLQEDYLMLKGQLLSNEAEIAHLRTKLKNVEANHTATLESAEEQIQQADEDLRNAYQNHAKLKKDHDKIVAEARSLRSTIAEIYANPDHEAHGSKHKGGDVSKAELQHARLAQAELSAEVGRLNAELAEAKNAVVASSGTQTIAELNDIIDVLREDFLASSAMNQSLGLEMDALREQANRIKDRNDELEFQLQNRARKPSEVTAAAEGASIAAEIDALNQSYDPGTRKELEKTVRMHAVTPQRRMPSSPNKGDRNTMLQHELDNCRATIARLTSEKAALERRLAESGMTADDLREFNAMSAKLQETRSSLDEQQEELDQTIRENNALRFMYKELKRSSVDTAQYNELRDEHERLSRTYRHARDYSDELETVNQALQFQVDALAVQVEHSDEVPTTPARYSKAESPRFLYTPAEVNTNKSKDDASEATMHTVVQNMQLRLSSKENDADLQRWKAESAETEAARLTAENDELRAKLAASDEARLKAVALLDKQTDPDSALHTRMMTGPRGVQQRRITELELELEIVQQRDLARREETKRIHLDAMMKATAKIQALEDRLHEIGEASRTKKSSPRRRHHVQQSLPSKEGSLTSDGRNSSTAFRPSSRKQTRESSKGADAASHRGRHRDCEQSDVLESSRSRLEVRRSTAPAATAREDSSQLVDGRRKKPPLSVLDSLMQSTSLRGKLKPGRD